MYQMSKSESLTSWNTQAGTGIVFTLSNVIHTMHILTINISSDMRIL